MLQHLGKSNREISYLGPRRAQDIGCHLSCFEANKMPQLANSFHVFPKRMKINTLDSFSCTERV